MKDTVYITFQFKIMQADTDSKVDRKILVFDVGRMLCECERGRM